MPKRARNESLTGGTGDVNPQWMILQFTPTSAGTTQSTAFIAPINRVPQSSSRATVMEVLKVVFSVPDSPSFATNAETNFSCLQALSTQDLGATIGTWANPSVFAAHSQYISGAYNANGTYGYSDKGINVLDLTDGAGHGILVATDTIYGQLAGTATYATVFRVRILYRVKNVSLGEYIGIVQSQQ